MRGYYDYDERVNNLEIGLTKTDERSKSNTKRLDEVEADLKENTNLIISIKELATETKYMREDLNKTIERLDKLENKDADKWDKFKWLLVAGSVTIILGFIAIQIGLK
jgi:chromosome segregation ATPase